MLLYMLPLLISLLGCFFIIERQHIVQLIPSLKASSLFSLGFSYLALGMFGAGLLFFLGENAFFLWVIGMLLLTAFIPIWVLFTQQLR